MPKLLFLGCNHDQKPYLEAIKKLKYTIIGTDLKSDPPGRSLCDRFYQIGYDNTEDLLAMGEKEGFCENDKVFTASAQFAHLGAAKFAKHFQIPYPEIFAIELCLDKTEYYEYFKNHEIPIPETSYVTSESELRGILNQAGRDERYYLKSDFSKNPNYVYPFSAGNVPWGDIFWGRDRYLRYKYILQKEFPGVSLRINIYGDRFNVFDFKTNQKTDKYHDDLAKLGIINTIRKLMYDLELQKWLVKFDIILNEEAFVVLDIGLDPPYRMHRESTKLGIDFEECYVQQYLQDQITYPGILD